MSIPNILKYLYWFGMSNIMEYLRPQPSEQIGWPQYKNKMVEKISLDLQKPSRLCKVR